MTEQVSQDQNINITLDRIHDRLRRSVQLRGLTSNPPTWRERFGHMLGLRQSLRDENFISPQNNIKIMTDSAKLRDFLLKKGKEEEGDKIYEEPKDSPLPRFYAAFGTNQKDLFILVDDEKERVVQLGIRGIDYSMNIEFPAEIKNMDPKWMGDYMTRGKIHQMTQEEAEVFLHYFSILKNRLASLK